MDENDYSLLMASTLDSDMGEDGPRLRSSPMKPPALPPKPTLRQTPASPKPMAVRSFATTFGRTQSSLTLPSRDGATASASLAATRASDTAGVAPLIAPRLQQSASTISLRQNATYFSVTTGTFLPRTNSKACLPVAPLSVPSTTTTRASAAPLDLAAVHQPPPVPPRRQRSKTKLEPVSEPAQSAPIDTVTVPTLPPPRPTLSASQSTGGLQRTSGGGLSRSQGTTRLVPAREVLGVVSEEVKQVSLDPSSSIDTTPPNRPPSLQSRGRLTASPSASSAIRIRPPSPSRAAKTNSGLERSISSIVVGSGPPPSPSKRGRLPKQQIPTVSSTSSIVIDRPDTVLPPSTPSTVLTAHEDDSTPKAVTRSRLVPSPSTSALRKRHARRRSDVSMQRRGRSEKSRPSSPSAPLRRSASTALIINRGPVTVVPLGTVILPRSPVKKDTVVPPIPTKKIPASPNKRAIVVPPSPAKKATVIPPSPSKKTTVIPNSPSKNTTVVPRSPAKFIPGPPQSPLLRSAKRRLVSTSEDSEETLELPTMDTSAVKDGPTEMVMMANVLPSASFFLRDSCTDSTSDSSFVTPPTTTVAVTSSYGNDERPSSSMTTTPTSSKPVRRSKKMRRLEMETGEVDEEARDLIDQSSLSSGKKPSPKVRTSTANEGTARGERGGVRATSATRGGVATPTSPMKKNTMMADDVEMMSDDCASPGPLSSHLSPIALPPPPPRSAMRRQIKEKKEEEDDVVMVETNKSSKSRSIRFNHVHVFLFGRDQGYQSVPSSGEVCLGMEARHHYEERYRLDHGERGRDRQMNGDGEGCHGGANDGMDGEYSGGVYGLDPEAEEELSDGEIRPLHNVRMPVQSSPRILPLGNRPTHRFIEPLTSKHRSKLLRLSGVKIHRDPTMSSVHEEIRRRRRECGCSCTGGRCMPATCECALNGIPCQVDNEDGFPCNCASDSCQNDNGRVVFNPENVHNHYQTTFHRLRTIERLGDNTRGSPTLIRFTDDDEVKHNATSYLATPPPAIYTSPMPSSAPSEPVLPVEVTTTLAPITPTLSTSGVEERSSSLLCTPPPLVTPLSMTTLESRDDGEQSHSRFPVTPVYRKYNDRSQTKSLPLSRVAMFKASTLAAIESPPTIASQSVPVETPPTVPAEAPPTFCSSEILPDRLNLADMDSDMDTSLDYATPPEGMSPRTQSYESASSQPITDEATTPPRPPAPPSPRKFALFKSLV